MAVPADLPGSPMDWFNNAAGLEKIYPNEWIAFDGKGVKMHGHELKPLLQQMDKIPEASTWGVAFVLKNPRL